MSFVCLCGVLARVDTLRESYGFLHLHHGPIERAAHLAKLSSGRVVLAIGRNFRHEVLLISDPHALRDTFASIAFIAGAVFFARA